MPEVSGEDDDAGTGVASQDEESSPQARLERRAGSSKQAVRP